MVYKSSLINGIENKHNQDIIRMICRSMEFHIPIVITYAEKGRATIIIGDIHYFNETDNYIKVVDKFEHIEAIPIESIMDIQHHD